MTMDIRKSKRDEVTEEEEWELQQFEEQYRNRAKYHSYCGTYIDSKQRYTYVDS